MVLYQINFQPSGRRGSCSPNKSLLDCARQFGVGILSTCGGLGICHSCKVQVSDGAVSKPASSELEAFSSRELKKGWRLACQTHPTSDCQLTVPLESMTAPQRMQVEARGISVRPEPLVRSYYVKLAPPSLSDLKSDADRLLETLYEQHHLRCYIMDLNVLRCLPQKIRAWDWQCQASVRNNKIIAVGPRTSRQLGLAIDLGTTKIAGFLVDLSNGQTLAAKAAMNPQISFGEDIIARLSCVIGNPAKAVEMQGLVVEAINRIALDTATQVEAQVEEILDAAIVGNVAMHHLLLRLPVGQLAFSPFLPAVSKALDVKASNLGIHIAPGAYAHLPANIAGFVGSDHVAALLSTDVLQAEGVSVVLDIGTNTEISLIDNGEITTVSCASGPAFEGGHIKDGMRAASGAIERLRIIKGDIQYHTIDERPPIGICGSGILDAIAQMRLAGILDEGGRMAGKHPRLRTYRRQREFVLVSEEERDGHPAISITQRDVREFQLAKASIQAGIQVLLEARGYTQEKIHRIIVAGAFGSYIDVSSAVAIGMFPSLPSGHFQQVGNAAGMGARLALISSTKRAQAQIIPDKVNYLELANSPDFRRNFVQASYLGPFGAAYEKRKVTH